MAQDAKPPDPKALPPQSSKAPRPQRWTGLKALLYRAGTSLLSQPGLAETRQSLVASALASSRSRIRDKIEVLRDPQGVRIGWTQFEDFQSRKLETGALELSWKMRGRVRDRGGFSRFHLEAKGSYQSELHFFDQGQATIVTLAPEAVEVDVGIDQTQSLWVSMLGTSLGKARLQDLLSQGLTLTQSLSLKKARVDYELLDPKEAEARFWAKLDTRGFEAQTRIFEDSFDFFLIPPGEPGESFEVELRPRTGKGYAFEGFLIDPEHLDKVYQAFEAGDSFLGTKQEPFPFRGHWRSSDSGRGTWKVPRAKTHQVLVLEHGDLGEVSPPTNGWEDTLELAVVARPLGKEPGDHLGDP